MVATVDNDKAASADENSDAVRQTALDYIEGWYSGDADRMRRSLHPDLVKRTVVQDSELGQWQLYRPTTADMMVAFTEAGGGSDTPESQRIFEVEIIDIYKHIALVRCVSPDFIDYLQLANLGDDGWLIVNVLWESRDSDPDSGT